MNEHGALPSQLISQLIRIGEITISNKSHEDQVKPASLDLTLGQHGWCVRSTFLPKADEDIEQTIEHYALSKINLTESMVLNVGSTFIFELQEKFKLDNALWALVSPKSSSGRVNLWVRTLANNYPRFDRLPSGYKGKLYVMISAKSWPVKIRQGDSLNQIRFFKGSDTRLSGFELQLLNKEVGLIYSPEGDLLTESSYFSDGGLLLSANINEDISAYVARSSLITLDLCKIRGHKREDFFTPISAKDGELLLKKGEFYILPSWEFLRIPPQFASEMIAYDIAAGEFRSHYAGFFDPGFGFGKKGTILGAPAVLEVIPHEDAIIRHRQPVCKMVYERMLAYPEKIYGAGIKSNYFNQRGPQLSKHFI